MVASGDDGAMVELPTIVLGEVKDRVGYYYLDAHGLCCATILLFCSKHERRWDNTGAKVVSFFFLFTVILCQQIK